MNLNYQDIENETVEELKNTYNIEKRKKTINDVEKQLLNAIKNL